MSVIEKIVDQLPPKYDRLLITLLLGIVPVVISITIAFTSQIRAIQLQDERIEKLEKWRNDVDKSLGKVGRNLVRIGSKLGVEMENPE